MAQTWHGPFAINRLFSRLNGTTVGGAGEDGPHTLRSGLWGGTYAVCQPCVVGRTFLSALTEHVRIGAMRSFASAAQHAAAAQDDTRFWGHGCYAVILSGAVDGAARNLPPNALAQRHIPGGVYRNGC
ncbi:MAG TPA: hypothetical protein PLE60_08840 [Candidatus Latescibacteria bacterium]|nr:hypothetical protein [Candidatus Latescibacterota bacterium]